MKKLPKIYCVITIDTEADHSFNWKKSNPLSFNSITDAIPLTLDPLFKKYGAVATYLLTTEVLENSVAVEVLKGIKNCELGTHLHPEYIEPDKEFFDYCGTYSFRFSCNYPANIENEKIANITRLFKEKLGYSPIVYRGGKFGFNDNTAAALSSLGYLVDTSVTPKISWKKLGGPDFRNFPDQPYEVYNKNNGRLLEVPVTIMFFGFLRKILNRPTWLRPTFSSGDRMKKLIDKFIHVHYYSHAVILNIMFHSMEFYAGASPYSETEEDCRRLVDNLEKTLKHCQSIGAEFCGLSSVRKVWDKI